MATSMTTNAPAAPPTLTTLPTELFLDIAKHLRVVDIARLRTLDHKTKALIDTNAKHLARSIQARERQRLASDIAKLDFHNLPIATAALRHTACFGPPFHPGARFFQRLAAQSFAIWYAAHNQSDPHIVWITPQLKNLCELLHLLTDYLEEALLGSAAPYRASSTVKMARLAQMTRQKRCGIGASIRLHKMVETFCATYCARIPSRVVYEAIVAVCQKRGRLWRARHLRQVAEDSTTTTGKLHRQQGFESVTDEEANVLGLPSVCHLPIPPQFGYRSGRGTRLLFRGTLPMLRSGTADIVPLDLNEIETAALLEDLEISWTGARVCWPRE